MKVLFSQFQIHDCAFDTTTQKGTISNLIKLPVPIYPLCKINNINSYATAIMQLNIEFPKFFNRKHFIFWNICNGEIDSICFYCNISKINICDFVNLICY